MGWRCGLSVDLSAQIESGECWNLAYQDEVRAATPNATKAAIPLVRKHTVLSAGDYTRTDPSQEALTMRVDTLDTGRRDMRAYRTQLEGDRYVFHDTLHADGSWNEPRVDLLV